MNELRNVSMMILGGFTAVLGLTAVAYALTVLHAPLLVTTSIVTVLGLAAISFFSSRANPAPPIVLNVPPYDVFHPLLNQDLTFSANFQNNLQNNFDQRLVDALNVPRLAPVFDDSRLNELLVRAQNHQREWSVRPNSIFNDSIFNSNVSRESTLFNDNHGNNYPELSTQSASLNEISY